MSNNLFAVCTQLDKSTDPEGRALVCGEWREPFETFTGDVGILYRDCVREYGRCTGHVFVDVHNGGTWRTERVGWVFVKRVKYEDWRPGGRGPRDFLQETWFSMTNAPEAWRRKIP